MGTLVEFPKFSMIPKLPFTEKTNFQKLGKNQEVRASDLMKLTLPSRGPPANCTDNECRLPRFASNMLSRESQTTWDDMLEVISCAATRSGAKVVLTSISKTDTSS